MRFKDTIGISHAINQLEHRLTQTINAELKELNLTLPQYSALSNLEDSGKMTNAELSRRCHVTPQTMNKIMDSLFRAKLVIKKDDKENQLRINYALTAKAEKLICKAHERVNEIEKKSLLGMAKSDLKKLNDIIAKMSINLDPSDVD